MVAPSSKCVHQTTYRRKKQASQGIAHDTVDANIRESEASLELTKVAKDLFPNSRNCPKCKANVAIPSIRGAEEKMLAGSFFRDLHVRCDDCGTTLCAGCGDRSPTCKLDHQGICTYKRCLMPHHCSRSHSIAILDILSSFPLTIDLTQMTSLFLRFEDLSTILRSSCHGYHPSLALFLFCSPVPQHMCLLLMQSYELWIQNAELYVQVIDVLQLVLTPGMLREMVGIRPLSGLGVDIKDWVELEHRMVVESESTAEETLIRAAKKVISVPEQTLTGTGKELTQLRGAVNMFKKTAKL